MRLIFILQRRAISIARPSLDRVASRSSTSSTASSSTAATTHARHHARHASSAAGAGAHGFLRALASRVAHRLVNGENQARASVAAFNALIFTRLGSQMKPSCVSQMPPPLTSTPKLAPSSPACF